VIINQSIPFVIRAKPFCLLCQVGLISKGAKPVNGTDIRESWKEYIKGSEITFSRHDLVAPKEILKTPPITSCGKFTRVVEK